MLTNEGEKRYRRQPPGPASRQPHRLWLCLLIICLGLGGPAALASAQSTHAAAALAARHIGVIASLQVPGTAAGDLNAVHFVSPTTGWAVGGGGTIQVSGDGGASWTAQTSGVTSTLSALAFVDATTGWAVGYGGVILHTSNAGVTWTPQQSGTSQNLTAVDFVDAQHGWAVGGFNTMLYPDDGGQSWSPQQPPAGYSFFHGAAIDFWDQTHGWVAPWGGIPDGGMFATSDGGTSWITQTTALVYYMVAVDFINASEGWAAGYVLDSSICPGASGFQTRLFLTVNGGQQWVQLPPVCGLPSELDFIDAQRGWLLLYQHDGISRVLETNDRGTSWHTRYVNGSVRLADIQLDGQGGGWMVGQDGFSLRGRPPQLYLPLLRR